MLPTYTNGSPGRASEYVLAVATTSWLWMRSRRTGGLRFVTRLPKPSVHSTRGPVSGSPTGGSVLGPSESAGTPDASAAAAGANTSRPSNVGAPCGRGASSYTACTPTSSITIANNPLSGPM